MPLTIFHLNCILLLMMKMNFIHEKLEQRVEAPLKLIHRLDCILRRIGNILAIITAGVLKKDNQRFYNMKMTFANLFKRYF